jgi:exosome complex component RRP45
VILSRILEKAIRRSNAIDTESLCIIAGLKCWSVRADVHVLNADGNLIDASCLAILAALQHFRRPDVSVDGEDVTIYTIEERVPVPLSIMHHPICITFSFYHDGQIFILDASLREEQVREGEVIVTVNQYGEVCQIAKLGGVSVEPMTMLQIVSIAESKAKEIDQIISKGLLQDSLGRNVEGLIAELSAENER